MKKAVSIYVAFAAAGYGLALLLPGYLAKAPSAIFSFPVEDGWCKVGMQSIGRHCFGDFYYPITTSNLPNPWASSPNPNPPLMQFIYKIFWELGIQGHFALVVYLMLLVSALVFPIFYLLKKRLLAAKQLAVITFFMCTSAPVLIAVDRGSFSIVIMMLTYFAFISHSNGSKRRSAFLLTLIFLLKPQMVLLDLILLNKWTIRRVATLLLLQVGLLASTFILYPSSMYHEAIAYFRQVAEYQNYVPWGALYPINLSMTTFPGVVAKAIFSPSVLPNLRLIFSAVICLFILARMKMIRDNLVDFDLLIISLLSILTLPGVTFAYYLTLLIVPFLVGFVLVANGDAKSIGILETSRVLRIGFLSFSILLFIPWTIPWSIFFGRYVVGHAVVTTSMNWILGILILQSCFLLYLLKAPSGIQSETASTEAWIAKN